MINGAVGYQALDDGSFLSLALLFASTAALFIGTGYIALDTGYDWSGYWNNNTTQNAPNQEYSLYTLYLLAPLVFLFVYFWLAFFLVVRVLGERKPLGKCSVANSDVSSLIVVQSSCAARSFCLRSVRYSRS